MRRLGWIAVAGYSAFAAGVMLWRLQAPWNSIHVDEVHQKAAEVAAAVAGVDVRRWIPTSTPRVDNALDQWRRSHPGEAMAVAPFYIVTHFQEPGGIGAAEVHMTPEGQPRLVRLLGPPHARPAIPVKQQRIDQAFAAMAGGWASRFKPEPSGPADREERFRWSAPADSMNWRLTVSLEMGRFRQASIEPVYTGAWVKRAERARFFSWGSFDTVRDFFWVAGVLWALVICISGWVRGILDHRLAWSAAAAFTAVQVLARVASGEGFSALMILGIANMAVIAAVLTGAGRIVVPSSEWPRWQAFLLLAKLEWNARSVGQSVLAGLGWAGAIAAAPLLVASAFPEAALNLSTYGAAALARWPVIATLSPLVDRGLYGVFVFFAAAARRRSQSGRAVAAAVMLAASAGVLFTGSFSGGIAAAVISAGICGALLTAVYWAHGLLAVLTAIKATAMLAMAAAFLRPGPGLWGPAAWLGGLLVSAAVLAWWIERNGEDLAPAGNQGLSESYLSAREKLKAEFSLAHEAQQRLLPSAAPALEGFSVAGLCHPARDVGGDLYDYFALPDGRLGICVADVSGKGMPAALYMTLTKGVLAAAAPDCAGVADLSVHLNRHLYSACRRRVFVTAVIAAVDAERNEVEFVRAGHNPVLVHSRQSQTARYLAPKGIGLGLAKGLVFERSIVVERIELERGDTVLLYSDGVTEAMNAQREQYGEDRLKAALERCAEADAESVVAEIRRDIGQFTGNEPAHDDITIVVLQARRQVTISS